jgi:hypothetical protein
MLRHHVDRERELITLSSGLGSTRELCASVEKYRVECGDPSLAVEGCDALGGGTNAIEVCEVECDSGRCGAGVIRFGYGGIQSRSVSGEEHEVWPTPVFDEPLQDSSTDAACRPGEENGGGLDVSFCHDIEYT